MNTDELSKSIRKIAEHVFSKVEHKSVAGYSIQSHDTADSVFFAVLKKGSIEADFESRLFNVEEWDEYLESPEVDTLNSLIASIYDKMDDYENDPGWHKRFRELKFGSSLTALNQMKEEGFWSNKAEEIPFVMFWVCGAEISEKEGVKWCEQLNGKDLGVKYASWKLEEKNRINQMLKEFERTGKIDI